MERAQAFMENFIGNWNGDFPNYPLTAEDLKKPHAVMGALLQVLDRLGIDTDVVLAVKALEEKKNRLLEMLNEQAEEKGKRAGRLEKLDHDIKMFEEELKQEKEIHDEEKLELEAIQKENKQTEMIIEQKKSHRDALMAEVARKRALRVYDADDIKAQAEQATQNLQELEEKLDSLRAILMQKENSLKNLQTIKPNLDSANNLLHEIMKLSDSLNSLREAEEKDKKLRERSKKALQRTEEIKELTTKYENEKTAGIEQLATIKNNFCAELKSVEELLLKKVVEAEKKVEEKLKNRHV
ncbi:hypothetical protein HF086_015437 [Spodoptera exigua]|uniref:Uncharacterized protein n=1 Tax=Spodoptera exigua TaxID=7107 RepID=A0A922MX57_SPOEX|nr:hypothetical protein HF086_015437 [Spodoptera exigua]